MDVLDWIRRRRQWNADHERAWKGYDVPGPSGLSPFQVRCEETLIEHLARRGVGLAGRRVEGKRENYIHAQVGDSAWSVWIYLDQAELTGPGPGGINLEQWDALTPDELIGKYLRHVDSVLDRISAHSPADAESRARGGRGESGRAVQQADAADEAQGGTRTAS